MGPVINNVPKHMPQHEYRKNKAGSRAAGMESAQPERRVERISTDHENIWLNLL